MKCEYCGAQLPEGVKFCPNCGAPAGQSASAEPTLTIPEPPHAPQPPVVQDVEPGVRLCPNCGAEVGSRKFCIKCGAKLEDAPQPKREAAKPQKEPAAAKAAPEMTGAAPGARLCPNCGAELGKRVICPKCGAKVGAAPAAKGEKKAPKAPPAAAASKASKAPKEPKAAKAPKEPKEGKSKGGLMKIGAGVLAAVLIIGLIPKGGGKKEKAPKESKKPAATQGTAAENLTYTGQAITVEAGDEEFVFDYKGMDLGKPDFSGRTPATAEVSPESPKATANGVTVNMGQYTLDGPATLSVTKGGILDDDDTGVWMDTYEVSVGDMHEFDDFIEIHIPYDDSEITEGMDPQDALGGKYYNADTGVWETVLSWVDVNAHEVILYMDHLTPIAKVHWPSYMNVRLGNDGRMYRVANPVNIYRRLAEQDAVEVAQEFADRGGDVGNKGLKASGTLVGEVFKIMSDNDTSLSGDVSQLADTYGLVTAISSLGDVNFSTPFLQKMHDIVGPIGQFAAGANIIGTLMKGAEATQEERLGTYKNMMNLAISIDGFKPLGVAMSGVFCIDYALDKLFKEGNSLITAQLDPVYRFYNDKYTPALGDGIDNGHTPRGPKEWRKEVIRLIKADPANAADNIKEEIDRFCEEFWTLSSDQMQTVMTYMDKSVYGQFNAPVASPSVRQAMIDSYKGELYGQMGGWLVGARNYFDKQAKLQAVKQLEAGVALLNTECTIYVREQSKGQEDAAYEYCKVALEGTDESRKNDFTATMGPEYTGCEIKFPAWLYLLADSPTKLRLYESGTGKLLAETELKVNVPTTYAWLDPDLIKFQKEKEEREKQEETQLEEGEKAWVQTAVYTFDDQERRFYQNDPNNNASYTYTFNNSATSHFCKEVEVYGRSGETWTYENTVSSSLKEAPPKVLKPGAEFDLVITQTGEVSQDGYAHVGAGISVVGVVKDTFPNGILTEDIFYKQGWSNYFWDNAQHTSGDGVFDVGGNKGPTSRTDVNTFHVALREPEEGRPSGYSIDTIAVYYHTDYVATTLWVYDWMDPSGGVYAWVREDQPVYVPNHYTVASAYVNESGHGFTREDKDGGFRVTVDAPPPKVVKSGENFTLTATAEALPNRGDGFIQAHGRGVMEGVPFTEETIRSEEVFNARTLHAIGGDTMLAVDYELGPVKQAKTFTVEGKEGNVNGFGSKVAIELLSDAGATWWLYNWERVGELKEEPKAEQKSAWHLVDVQVESNIERKEGNTFVNEGEFASSEFKTAYKTALDLFLEKNHTITFTSWEDPCKFYSSCSQPPKTILSGDQFDMTLRCSVNRDNEADCDCTGVLTVYGTKKAEDPLPMSPKCGNMIVTCHTSNPNEGIRMKKSDRAVVQVTVPEDFTGNKIAIEYMTDMGDDGWMTTTWTYLKQK